MNGERCWKVAAYIRLSREDGNEESLSVTNQRNIIAEFMQRSFSGNWIWAGEYVDDGVTGTGWERPGFQCMLEEIEKGKVDCVICKTLSRAFRNYADQGYFLESYFPRYGVRFISLGGPALDSYLQPEALCGYEVPISGIMNDRYAGRTSMDVRRTLNMKRQRGEFIGAFAPYGYAKSLEEKGKLVVDEPAAAVVRDLFAWRLEGMSCQEIVQRLNEREIPAPSVYKRQAGLPYQNPKLEAGRGLWSVRTVSEMLRNPVYTGTMVQGRQQVVSYKIHKRRAVPPEEWFVVEHTHPALVDETTFRLVSQLSGIRAEKGDGKQEERLFAGLLFCGCCGGRMCRKTAKGHVYYACRRKNTPEGRCAGSSIREDRVEKLLRLVLEREGKQICRGRMEEWKRGKQAEREQRRIRELERLDQMLDDLYIDWKMGEIEKEAYRRIRGRIEEKKRRQQETGEKEKSLSKDPGVETGKEGRMERALLLRFIQRVEIFPNREIVIFLRHAPGEGGSDLENAVQIPFHSPVKGTHGF